LLRDKPDPVSDERLDLTKCRRLRARCHEDFDGAKDFDLRIQTTVEVALDQGYY